MTTRQEAYEQLQQAIDTCARLDHAEGVLTDWVVLYATQNYDAHGDSRAQVGRLTPADSAQYYRVLGLLDYAQTRARAEVANL